jgi:N-acetylglucosaminyldiphosphoundecaprenol N-acetyl-beta-D-mannosaminyltransferase
MSMGPAAISRKILGLRVDGTSYPAATREIIRAAKEGQAGYVCVANVHMVMEAYDDRTYQEVVNRARLVTPDGVPLVWSLRQMGVAKPTRVYGPDLTLWVLEAAARQGVRVGFYGSTEAVLERLLRAVRERFPALEVAFAYSPPFTPVAREQEEALIRRINESGAQILFVGLGCPKQERWMAGNESRIQAIMLGVGAAFDFLAGSKPQAPAIMQRLGLEWVFRFATEPRRLWKRYMKHNPRFVFLMTRQLLRGARDIQRSAQIQ